jgi:hypothetical protein
MMKMKLGSGARCISAVQQQQQAAVAARLVHSPIGNLLPGGSYEMQYRSQSAGVQRGTKVRVAKYEYTAI